MKLKRLMSKYAMISILLALMFNYTIVRAEVTLPAIFSSHMVLQQNAQVALWGKAKPKTRLTVLSSWNHKMYSVNTAEDGSWNLKIATPEAGGPYEITFNDGVKLTLSDVLIGEVWLCAGQSNMEMPVKGFSNQPILHSNDLLMGAEEPGVRIFRVEKNISKNLVSAIDSKWEVTHAGNVKEFSAVGYQFARMLQQSLKVPVGIIQSAYGGTDIEAWMDKNSLMSFSDFKIPAAEAKIGKNDPGVLYNAMINPIKGYHIKGVLWYQGENNRFNPLTYDKKMAAMVALWRKEWNCGTWPFYYVQIAPNNYKDQKEQIPLLYEAQSRAMKLIPNSGMVVSVDAGSMSTIHPPDKTIISKRLAYWALANTYGKVGISYMGPVYQSIKTTEDSCVLTFDNVLNGMTTFDQKLISFEIAAEDRIFHPAEAKITGRTIIVKNIGVKNPVAVRYAFKDVSAGNLYNVEGLPAAPFRTDNW